MTKRTVYYVVCDIENTGIWTTLFATEDAFNKFMDEQMREEWERLMKDEPYQEPWEEAWEILAERGNENTYHWGSEELEFDDGP